MGRNSSGTRGGLQPGDATYKGSIGKPEPLVNMKDPALYKATKEAISRYHAVLGVRQKNVSMIPSCALYLSQNQRMVSPPFSSIISS